MIAPASTPRAHAAHRLLVVGADGDRQLLDSARFAAAFAPGDLLVVNDAATLPASLVGDGIELRLLGTTDDRTWTAGLLGPGDFHLRTEDRPLPPRCPVGTRIVLEGLVATVTRVHDASWRLVDIVFDRRGDALWSALYRVGKPVQYAHVSAPLALWDVQNVYAGRPWALEMPSAGRILDVETLLALRARGVEIATVTHAAGVSSVGDPVIDAMLPLPERFEVTDETWDAVARARARGGRIVAIGTSAARALEGGARAGTSSGVTSLRLGTTLRRAIVDGIVTGIHEPGTSHFELLEAFVPRETLLGAIAASRESGLLGHELGDAWLVWSGDRVPGREDHSRGGPAHR